MGESQGAEIRHIDGGTGTLAEVGGILFEEGFCTTSGKAYAPAQIKRLLGC